MRDTVRFNVRQKESSFPDECLDTRQAARFLGASTALLRKWRRTGDGPAFARLQKLVRYRRRDLEAFIEAHLVGGAR
jgi:hypothetical protein